MLDSNGPASPSHRRWVWVVLVLLLMAAVAWWWYPKAKPSPASSPSSSAPGGPPAVPVKAEVVSREDLDIYLKALGTVTAFNTVTVRSRVQGELNEILFKEGDQVKAGQLLARIDPRPYEVALQQALGMQQQNMSQYENAKRDLVRYQTLRKQESIAPQQVDTQQALVRKYEGIIRSDQAAVDNARLQLDYTRITAPISGRLGLRKVDVGNLISANDPQGLVVITQTQPISVLFTLSETDLPEVRQPMLAGKTLTVDAYDRADEVRLAQGKLLTVDNQIDVATGSFKLKAEFQNLDDMLFPNQFVNVRLHVRTLNQATTVPSGAILQGNQGAFVYIVKPDMTVEVRLVKIGPRSGDRVAVLEGLQPGDRVVLEGTDRLRAGTRVRIVNASPTTKP